jgi:hypothetical protein
VLKHLVLFFFVLTNAISISPVGGPESARERYGLISVIKISSQRKSNDDSLLNIFALFLLLYFLGGGDQMNIEYEI